MSFIFHEPPLSQTPRKYAPLAVVVTGDGRAFNPAYRLWQADTFEPYTDYSQRRRYAPIPFVAPVGDGRAFAPVYRYWYAETFEPYTDYAQHRRYGPGRRVTLKNQQLVNRQPRAWQFDDTPDPVQRRRYAPVRIPPPPASGAFRDRRYMSLFSSGLWDTVQPQQRPTRPGISYTSSLTPVTATWAAVNPSAGSWPSDSPDAGIWITINPAAASWRQ